MKAAPDVRRRYRQVLRALRAECPLHAPVRVLLDESPAKKLRRGAWQSCPAWSMGGADGFRVVLKTSMYERGARRARAFHPSEIADMLIHEWAHCLAWSADNTSLEDHGPSWGVAYAACYRAIIED